MIDKANLEHQRSLFFDVVSVFGSLCDGLRESVPRAIFLPGITLFLLDGTSLGPLCLPGIRGETEEEEGFMMGAIQMKRSIIEFYKFKLFNPEATYMMIPFFIWEDKNLKKIDLMTVTALEINGNYTNVYFHDASFYMVRVSMKKALKLLPPDMFIRVSRKCAVSIYFIHEIRPDEIILRGRSVTNEKRPDEIILRDRSVTNEIRPDEIIVQDRSVTSEKKPDEIIVQDRSVTIGKGYFELIKSQVKILGNKDYPGSSQDEQNPNDDPDPESEEDDDE